jgi:hypothetical protein
VSELHKICLFIYIPWTKSGLLTLFTYTLTGLFANNVFSFYGFSYSDTSQGWYSDHHFHFGYFLYGAAAIAKLDPSYFEKEGRRAAIDAIVKDICNPDPADLNFPLARHKVCLCIICVFMCISVYLCVFLCIYVYI